MPLIIPVFPGTPLYQERVRLEARDYIFRFDWAHREQRYYMSIFNQDEEPLLQGVKVLANWPLLARHHFNPGLPPGQLIATSLEQDDTPPTFNDFGTRVQLAYYASDEDLEEFA